MKQKKTWNYTIKRCPLDKLEEFINGMDNQGYDLIQVLHLERGTLQIYKSREDVLSIE